MNEPQMTKLNKNQLKIKNSDLYWIQWFAGLIDGNGCFYISKQNQPSLEITAASDDFNMLQQIKDRVGGIVKLRAGSNSVRLRVFQKKQIEYIIKCVNGHIRLKVRQQQFKKMCLMFNIEYLEPKPLNFNNAYIAGFFDADGSITISISKCSAEHSQIKNSYGKYIRLKHSRGWHTLSVHITNKDKSLLNNIYQALGVGKLITEPAKKEKSAKQPNPIYRLYFKSFKNINTWLKYIINHPLQSSKRKRCLLLSKYFELYYNKAHLRKTDCLMHKQWDNFCKRWFQINT